MYKYETHLHSSHASACGHASAEKLVDLYKEAGFSGFIMTDHFLNGNTCIPSELSWNERIEAFCESYYRAEKAAENKDFLVLFGLEYGFHGTEFLVYNSSPEFLKSHPDMLDWEMDRFFREFKEAGAFIIHAHPFRKRDYIKEIRLFPDRVDAVEIYNGGNDLDEWNTQAEEYAAKYTLPVISGSDFHGLGQPGLGGIELPEKAGTIQEIILSITEKRCVLRKG